MKWDWDDWEFDFDFSFLFPKDKRGNLDHEKLLRNVIIFVIAVTLYLIYHVITD